MSKLDGLKKIELIGYQTYGIPVLGSLPYSNAFFLNMTGVAQNIPLVADRASIAGGITGVPIPLDTLDSYRRLETPVDLATHLVKFPGLPSAQRINLSLIDMFNQPAQFVSVTLYCNVVYDDMAKVDIDASSRLMRKRNGTYAESSVS